MQQNKIDSQKDPSLKNSENVYPESNNANQNEPEGDDLFDSFNEDDDYSYGTSYEKYKGYNGWSDDVIDDAFDGDPEATWNVD